jgi:tetratricopeptide (TPR) repeat protein
MPPKEAVAAPAAGGGGDKAAKAREKKEKKLLEQQMTDSQAKCEEGRVLLEPEGKAAQPNYNKAIVAFDAAIELFQDNAVAFTYRGTCNKETGRLEQAIEDFSRAFALDPQNINALEGRAACYESMSQFDKAISDYTSIIEIHADNDHAYNMRGICRLRKKPPGLLLKSADFGAVINDFNSAVRVNENNYYAMANLGKAYEDQHMFKEAIAEYTRALQVKDDYIYAVFRRGCAALSFVERAIHEREQAPKVNSDDLSPDEVIEYEIKQETAGKEIQSQLENAVADFSRVINPDEREKELTSVIHRGTCYMYMNEFMKAEEEFRFAQKAIDTAELPHAALVQQALKTKNQVLYNRRERERLKQAAPK